MKLKKFQVRCILGLAGTSLAGSGTEKVRDFLK